MYWWGCVCILVKVSLRISGGVSICWWGCLYILVGVSLHVNRGVSIY